jgi:ArsR family transcriptional regulator, arsenate/arsenite/antimonite-responsive transcriptional repressor
MWLQLFWRFAQKTGGSLVARPMTSLHFRNMDRSDVEKISKALADGTRLRIFEAISATNQMSCGELVSMRGVTPATVSHHLKILSEAGLIACRREGQFVYSHAVPETIAGYTQALMKMGRSKNTARRRR